MPQHPAASIDAVVTDPPYHLASIVKRFGKPDAAPAQVGATGAYARASRGFMGKEWDGGDVAFDPDTWRAVFRVMKPGAHLVAFSGSRTYHRMACAIEDAGFEIRDQLMWLYGSGFPKSHDISKAIDKMAGVEFASKPAAGVGFMGADGPGGYNVTINQLTRSGESTTDAKQWQGFGTALKPAHEPMVLARKPISASNIAANVLEHGTGGLAIDACRVATGDNLNGGTYGAGPKKELDNASDVFSSLGASGQQFVPPAGRHPANVMHDGLTESWSKYFYHAKASHSDRVKRCEPCGTRYTGAVRQCPDCGCDTVAGHPTVKPLALMEYLCRLVTPPGGTILDPFAGTGSTIVAARNEGFTGVGIELEQQSYDDIIWRLAHDPRHS